MNPATLNEITGLGPLCEILLSDPMIAVWVLDAETKMVFCSPQASELFCGCTPEGLLGRPLNEIVPPASYHRLLTLRTMATERGESVVSRVVWKGQRIRTTYTIASNDTLLAVSRPDPVGLGKIESEVAEADYVELGSLNELTPRELEVLALMGSGMRIREIADHLGRSYKTVCSFRDSIGKKLGVTDRGELVSLARSAGLEPRHASLPRTTCCVQCESGASTIG
ncbi:MAG: LuxR C-terminal-related transcriptional regulator [Planctomycetota bacterium]